MDSVATTPAQVDATGAWIPSCRIADLPCLRDGGPSLSDTSQLLSREPESITQQRWALVVTPSDLIDERMNPRRAVARLMHQIHPLHRDLIHTLALVAAQAGLIAFAPPCSTPPPETD